MSEFNTISKPPSIRHGAEGTGTLAMVVGTKEGIAVGGVKGINAEMVGARQRYRDIKL